MSIAIHLDSALTKSGSGYTVNGLDVTLRSLDTMACISPIGVEATAASSNSPVPFPNGMQIHNAYQISWDATDKATLSLTPPKFDDGCSATLDEWVPGASVGSLPCNNRSEAKSWNGLLLFLEAGIPIIVVVLIASCGGFCFHKSRKRKRARDHAGQDNSRREIVGNPGLRLENVRT